MHDAKISSTLLEKRCAIKRYFCGLFAAAFFSLGVHAVAQESQLKIAEAKLGKDMKDRVLVNEDSTFALNERAYLWIRVTGGASDSISVTWKTGDDSYPTKLNIGGSPWRTWSYKTLAKAGPWTVTATDAAGNVLKEMSFNVEEMKK